jgi:hypothetical protein
MASNSYYFDPGFSCWFRDDINNALRAIDSASAEVFDLVRTPEMELYRRGYEAALRSMAEAFGIHYTPWANEEASALIEVRPSIFRVRPDESLR